MNYEYVCKKVQLDKKEFREAQVFFRNGDFFQLSIGEIVDIDIQFYDTLIAGERGFCPVAKSGLIKCKLKDRKPQYDNSLLYNQKEYSKNRKAYLENRCIEEGGIYYIRLFDKNHWHYGIYGDIVAYKEDGYLIFKFQANKTYGSAEKAFHVVNAPNITKQVVEKIDLDFENCDGFMIYQEEIQDIQINFKKELEWNSSCFGREIENGFIRLKLDKEIEWRRVNVYGCNEKIPNIKKLERRLCGRGIDDCDICHLYVYYKYAGYCREYEECIGIDDIRPWEEIEKEEKKNGFGSYIGGYAKREEDGSILIVFGKSKEEI
ncbi:MAG: hypothetical protein IJX98_07380 [Clostridia bacterium]|nr:hypothetical protein [Clostridia bacterium]